MTVGAVKAAKGDEALLLIFPGQDFTALFAAFRWRKYSITVGMTEIMMMAKMTKVKFFFTIGRLPKK
jgi:hypothetical protein